MRGENVQINSLAEDSALFRGEFLKAPWGVCSMVAPLRGCYRLGASWTHVHDMPNVRWPFADALGAPRKLGWASIADSCPRHAQGSLEALSRTRVRDMPSARLPFAHAQGAAQTLAWAKTNTKRMGRESV